MAKIVIGGTAHRRRELGKCSPDGRLLEWQYSRQIWAEIKPKLESLGYRVVIDYPDDDLPKNIQSASPTQERSRELNLRVSIVNAICKQYGAENCIYVPIHVDACPPADGKWHTAGGWSAWTTRGKTRADILAECLCEAAESNLKEYAARMEQGKKAGAYGANQRAFRFDYTDGDKDQEAGYYVLQHTLCPAVLTENLFQDNLWDVDYLLSDEGRHCIERLHVEGIANYFKSVQKL